MWRQEPMHLALAKRLACTTLAVVVWISEKLKLDASHEIKN
jgi:hypothetical protein